MQPGADRIPTVRGRGSDVIIKITTRQETSIQRRTRAELSFNHEHNGVSTNNAAAGTLQFVSGIADNQLWFDRVEGSGNLSSTGNNLRVTIMGSTDTVTVNGEFNSSTAYAALGDHTLTGSGLVLDSQLSNLVSAMASFETSYQSTYGVALIRRLRLTL